MSFRKLDWDFQKLEELIDARGEKVVVESGVACTCKNGDVYASTIKQEGKPASQRKLNCAQCKGDGFIYRNARTVKGLVVGVDPGRDRKLFELGYAVPGDATFSPSLNAQELADFDKVTFLFPVPLNEGQVIMRGAAQLEDNAAFVTDLEENEDRLWYEAECALWCEDENGVIYTQGIDFDFEAHKIKWYNSPNIGTLYTVKYTGYPEWIAYSTPFERIDRDRSLGQRVLIRKKHVAFMQYSSDDSVAKRAQEQEEFTTRSKV